MSSSYLDVRFTLRIYLMPRKKDVIHSFTCIKTWYTDISSHVWMWELVHQRKLEITMTVMLELIGEDAWNSFRRESLVEDQTAFWNQCRYSAGRTDTTGNCKPPCFSHLIRRPTLLVERPDARKIRAGGRRGWQQTNGWASQKQTAHDLSKLRCWRTEMPGIASPSGGRKEESEGYGEQ